ncbi:MAG: SCP2 sterol-binding domain-containing protein [Bacillota bacterium]|nr:SCP2 sterol-binding domain-containing protein [Bacillota bacterium]
MSGKPRYLSPEWKEQVEALLRSELTPEKMNHITSSMSNIYLNCPDGKERFMYFGFADGNLDRFLVEEGEAPQAEFKITGDYETFAKISRAEMNGQVGLMSGKLKLKGNMVKALKLASIADRLNKIIAKVEVEF